MALSPKPQECSCGVTKALSSALHEWLLMLMLLVSSLYSYLITKFAQHCKLQLPCVLCSRLDHFWGKEKLGYYWDLFCGRHRLEVSSLVLCHAHDKLVDVHQTCENCLFSFATINKCSAETYRLLVGKLGEDSKDNPTQGTLLEAYKLDGSKTKFCLCCGEPYTFRGYRKKLVMGSAENEGEGLGLPLSSPVRQNRNVLRKRKDKALVSAQNVLLRKVQHDPLYHVGYTEVKITSDTESENSLSDNDHEGAFVSENHTVKIDRSVQCYQLEPHIITLANDSAMEKRIDPNPAPDPSSLMPRSVVEPHAGASVVSNVAIDHDLEERGQLQVEHRENPSSHASFDSVSQLSGIKDFSVELSSERNATSPADSLTKGQDLGRNKPISPDHLSLEMPECEKHISSDVVPPSNAIENHADVSKEQCLTAKGEVQQTSENVCEEIEKEVSTEAAAETTGIIYESCQRSSTSLDLGDAYKLAVANRGRQLGRQLSDVLADQWIAKESSRASEDFKLLLSQLSAARGLDQLVTDSPGVSIAGDESKTSNVFNSTGMQLLQKRISLERNESNISYDGSIVSEIEGESEVDRLKRQIEYDRKVMRSLYRELEEERNASAVAANQAMAMITKLQEEKATMYMEALQSVRMMEEQSEYDMGTIQKTNALVAEKEKEVQDLHAELEFFRGRYPNESIIEKVVETSSELKSGDCVKQLEAGHVGDNS